ncbi:MAG: hypothetical protein GY768_26005 [Planctomycetaceae bacterium]|nr:hypothetical protein [Planctomycetaceae bacterium]
MAPVLGKLDALAVSGADTGGSQGRFEQGATHLEFRTILATGRRTVSGLEIVLPS